MKSLINESRELLKCEGLDMEWAREHIVKLTDALEKSSKSLNELCDKVKGEVWGLEDCPELFKAYQKAQKLLDIK